MGAFSSPGHPVGQRRAAVVLGLRSFAAPRLAIFPCSPAVNGRLEPGEHSTAGRVGDDCFIDRRLGLLGDSVSLVGAVVSLVGGAVTLVGVIVAFVGGVVAAAGSIVALLADPIALVAVRVALVALAVAPLRDRAVAGAVVGRLLVVRRARFGTRILHRGSIDSGQVTVDRRTVHTAPLDRGALWWVNGR